MIVANPFLFLSAERPGSERLDLQGGKSTSYFDFVQNLQLISSDIGQSVQLPLSGQIAQFIIL